MSWGPANHNTDKNQADNFTQKLLALIPIGQKWSFETQWLRKDFAQRLIYLFHFILDRTPLLGQD